jgi:hypothetical protein
MPFEFVARNGIIGLANSTISGSLAVSQSVTAQSFTGSLSGSALAATSASYALTASFATTSSYVLNAVSSSFASTASFVTLAQTASFVQTAQTASYVLNAVSASYATQALTASNANTASYVLQAISSSFATLAQTANTASFVQTSQTASYVLNAISSSFASTASSADNFTVRGTLTAQTIVAQTITSSIDFVTGSSRFGTLISNTHQFTGSVGITGSLAVTAGVINQLTSSFAVTASNANTASFVQTAQTASYVLNAISSSFASTASFVTLAQTASFVQNAQTASFVNPLRQNVQLTGSLFISSSTAALSLIGSGSDVFSVDGTSGRLFSVDDSLSGSLFSVNTAAGLPVIEAFSDNTIRMGQFGQKALFISQSRIGIGIELPTATLQISGSTGGLFEIDSNTLQNIFYVSSSGRVGIGLNTPVSGTLHVSGNVFATSFTGSLFGTASYASQSLSSSFATTASYVLNAVSASFAATASSADNFTVRGTLTAQTINVQTITSSIEFNTGSTRNGSTTANTHEFTGSVSITGSLAVNGTINPLNISDTFFPFKSGSVLGQSLLRQTSISNIIFGEDIGPTSPNSREIRLNGLNYAVIDLRVSGSSGANGYTLQARPGGSFAFNNSANNSQIFTLSQDANGNAFQIGGGGANVNFPLGNVAINWPNIYTIPTKFYVSGSSRLDGTLQAGTLSTDAHQFTGSVGISGSITSTGTITAQTLVVQTITSSIEFITGSTRNGSLLANTHQFTGSVSITGSLAVNGTDSGGTSAYITSNVNGFPATSGTSQPNAVLRLRGGDNAVLDFGLNSVNTWIQATDKITLGTYYNILLNPNGGNVAIGKQSTNAKLDVSGSVNITGSVNVTGSLTVTAGVINQLTSSFAVTASNANTASFVQTAQTASYVQTSQTASYVLNAQTASYVLQAVSASYATQALTASNANTASYIVTAQTASYVLTSQTASYVLTAQTASYVLQAVSSSYALSSSYATNAANAFIQNGNSFGTAATLGTNDAQNLQLETNNTTRIFISGSGPIGIGTTSPTGSNMSNLLHLNGTAAVLRVGPYYSVGGDRDFVEIIANGSDTKITSPNERFIVENTTGDIIISAGGKVGIGTTTPATKMEVLGTDGTGERTSPYNVLTVTADNPSLPYDGFGGCIVFNNRAYTSGIVSSARIRSAINNTSVNTFGGSIAFDVSATVGGTLTQAMLINYNGNVGIGTTSPSVKLVVSNGGNLGLEIDPTNTSGTIVNMFAYDRVASVYRPLALNSGGGNILIGTTTDSGYKLDVNGTGRFSGTLTVTNANINLSNAYYLTARNNANSAFLTLIGRNTSDKVVIDPDGYGVVVTGAATFSSSVTAGGGITASGQLYLKQDNTSASQIIISGLTDTNKQLIIGYYTTGNGYSAIQSIYQGIAYTPLVLQQYGGYVGIGTITPNAKLDVNGNISITGSGIFTSTLTVNSSGNSQVISGDGTYGATYPMYSFTGTTNGSHRIFAGTADEMYFAAATSRGFEFRANGGTAATVKILSTGNVGMGTGSPTLPSGRTGLVIRPTNSQTTAEIIVQSNNNTDGTTAGLAISNIFNDGAAVYQRANLHLRFGTNDLERMRITETGNVGIGMIGAAYKLDVSGSVRITGSLALGNIAPSATSGRIDASNDIVAYSTSDIRFKTNIFPISSSLEKIQQISGVEFDWIPDIKHGYEGHDVGVIAQELKKVLPEVVTTRDNGYLAVKYEKIIPLLIEAIKEQQNQIDELRTKLG